MSGYQEALEAAGAQVHAFESFGSYQGDWFAKVTLEGKTFFVSGAYGSCSGCDSFQAEFDYAEPKCEEHQYVYDVETTNACAGCAVARADYQAKLAEFGKHYLDDPQTFDEMLKYAKRNEDWDMEATEMVKWLEANQ